MSRAILEFTLPEDQQDFEDASNGWKYKHVISELQEYVRHRLKYDVVDLTTYKNLEEIRDKIVQFLDDNNLEL